MSAHDPAWTPHTRPKPQPELPKESLETKHAQTLDGVTFAYSTGDADLVESHQWRSRDGRVFLASKGITTLHRMLFDSPQGVMIDHVDGNPLNNTRQNLRTANSLENSRNCTQTKRTRRGQFKGIWLVRATGKWAASIRAGDRKPGDRRSQLKYLGSFTNPEEAARAYDRAALEYFGEFACTNFPRHEYSPSDSRVSDGFRTFPNSGGGL